MFSILPITTCQQFRRHDTYRGKNMPTVTYSPEDNKLRLYVGRVPRDEYEALRKSGWTSTPKQDCDFVATWTPAREDQAREYLDEGEDIGDEDYSPEERAADRAERFEGYREKRTDEATGAADTFTAGPQAFGHQNARRAERQARRHDRHRTYATSQWTKAEYWQQRTAGVISHALHKASASVRRGRILTLEAEQRKHEKSRTEHAERYAAWLKVLDMDGADEPIPMETAPTTPAGLSAYTLANYGCYGNYTHPRKERPAASLYTLLTLSEDPITPREAARLFIDHNTDPSRTDTYSYRWMQHYALRLQYENAMLENEGGKAAEVEMIPGGFLRHVRRHGDGIAREYQIHKINRSPATKRITSVEVWDDQRYTYKLGNRVSSPGLTLVNIERAGENVYRAPTEAELEAFQAAKKEAKDARTPIPTINPTDEEAQAIQQQWNAEAETKSKNGRTYAAVVPLESTQKQFSGGLKYNYVSITEFTRGDITIKLRTRRSGGYFDYDAPLQLIVLTDKPRKKLPTGFLTTTATPAPAGSFV